MTRLYKWLLVIASLLTIAFVIAIAFNLAPWLRGPKEWRWVYAIPGTFKRLWLPAAILLGHAFLAQRVHQMASTRKQAILAISLAVVMTPAIQLSLLYMDHPDVRSQLFYRTVSEGANGFFNVGAVVMDRDDFMRYFAERMLTWYPTHPQRHPPGLPVLFSLARQFFDSAPGLTAQLNTVYRSYQCHNVPLMNLPDGAIASATIQMILPFLLSLVVWPLYKLGKEVYDQSTAVRAILLWPLIPGMALWSAYWNPFYALFTVLAWLLFHLGLSRHRLIYLGLSGGVISAALFLSFGNAVIVAFLGLYALAWLIATPSRPKLGWLAAGAALFAAGVASLWIYLWFRHGLSFFAVWREAMGKHFEMDRTGWFWIFYHLYDFFVASVSIPIAIFWAAASLRAFQESWRQRRLMDWLALTFFVGLVLLDLSGTARGEVARVWAFLLPLPLLIAVYRLPQRRWFLIALIGLTSLQLFVSNIFIRYIGTDLSDPPAPPPEIVHIPDETLLQVTWEEGISLQSASIPDTVTAGEPITIRAVWSTSRPIDRPYTIFVHLYNAQGKLVAQRDVMPLDGNWPTTCWQPGGRFQDSYTLVELEPLHAGIHRVEIGLYWMPTRERLSLEGRADTMVEIGTLEITDRKD